MSLLQDRVGARLLEWQERADLEVFRLETRQSYASSAEDAALAAFLAESDQPALSEEDEGYLAAVRAAQIRGTAWRRVHVVTEPLSDYLRFELTWEYGPNVGAGEQVGLVPTVAGSWPDELPPTDFWLFDSMALFVMRYDSQNHWVGIDEIAEPGAVDQAVRWRDQALRLSTPWRDYMQAHPELLARVPLTREAS